MIPKISAQEPLKVQGQYFIDCIVKGCQPDIADADKAAQVVRTLTAVQKSMEAQGTLVKIG
jgi:hypothetical protein